MEPPPGRPTTLMAPPQGGLTVPTVQHKASTEADRTATTALAEGTMETSTAPPGGPTETSTTILTERRKGHMGSTAAGPTAATAQREVIKGHKILTARPEDHMEVSTAQQGMLPTLTVPPGGPTATSTTHMAQLDHHMGNMGAGHTTTPTVEDLITTHMPLLVLISTSMLPPSMVPIRTAPQEGLMATNMALAALMAQPGDPTARATTVPVEDIPALITNMQPPEDPMEVSMVPPSTDPTNMVPRGDPTTTSMAAIHMVPSDLMATTVLVGGTASSVEAVVISDNSGMASTAMTCTATLTEATSTAPPTSMEQPEHRTDSTELFLTGATTALLIHTAPQGTPTAPPETPMELLEIRMAQRGTPMAPPEIRMVPLAKTQPTARMELPAGPTAVSTAPIRMPPQGGLTRAVSMGAPTELLGTPTAPPGTPMDLPGTPTVRIDLTRETVLVRTAPPGDLTVPPGKCS